MTPGAIQTVREALAAYWSDHAHPFYYDPETRDATFAALDRVEAVVKAAREYVTMRHSNDWTRLVDALAALDSTEAPEPWHTEVSCSDDPHDWASTHEHQQDDG